MKEIVVYQYIENDFLPAGLLTFEQQGRTGSARFHYGRHYLQNPQAIPIDPVQLPLLNKEFVTPTGFDIFNGIRDAGPDRWGRYLLDKKYGKELDELGYIIETGADRVGSLAFSLDTKGPTHIEVKRLDLKLCVDAAEQALSDQSTTQLETFLEYGVSLGGARPKASILWNNKPHVAKFTLSMDRKNEALIEFATMLLAKNAGLNVPQLDTTRVSNRDIYLIERFDRVTKNGKEHPIPFISGLTATGLHEQDYADWSYLSLCEAINQLCKNPIEDKIELFKRMVFNILVFNNDDHMRNHGFIYVGDKKWALSPLYDVVPSITHSETYMLAMKIGDLGREASLDNARSAAKYFGISPEEAETYITALCEHTRGWEYHYRNCGVSEQDIAKLKHSFRMLE